MYRVLFVDDDEILLKVNRIYFEKHGYETYTAINWEQALSCASAHSFDCIVLDIILSNSDDGYHICECLREQTNAPIIFLTCLTEQDFLYRSFSAGGDDFMTKPYDLKELEMRVAARISQSCRLSTRGQILHFPPLSIDVADRRVSISGEPVEMTSNEFGILLFLASSPGQAFSLEEIYRNVWKMPGLDSTHTVQVHVARMRRKLEIACPGRKFITTAWGRGYLFSSAEEKRQPLA